MSLLSPIFPKDSGRPSFEIRVSQEKNYSSGILIEWLSTRWIFFSNEELEISTIFTHFCNPANNETMALKDKTKRSSGILIVALYWLYNSL